MARHHLSDPRVQALIDRLTSLTLELGSVNAVAGALSTDGAEPIYPNRLHGLLAGDPTRSVNTATLETIEGRIAAMNSSQRDPARESAQRSRALQAVAVETVASGDQREAIVRAAERLGLPLGVLQHVTGAVVGPSGIAVTAALAPIRKGPEPDWSWQGIAVERSLRALRRGARYKAGLVIPTGGGKTRIALTVALRWLDQSGDEELVLWVTHRSHLKTQARRTLQKLLSDKTETPESAADIFANRVKFVMVQDIASAVADYGTKTGLVIVDEAHHAAASSYAPIFEDLTAPSLFLTATPNRRDELPIGIDEICYTITYRELFDRGCLIEPTFEPPLDLPSLEWSEPGGVDDLADYLLGRAEVDFNKTLVVVPLQVRAEVLYEALSRLLADRPGHVLTPDNIGYVHGSGTSGSGTPSDFLDEFSAWPSGIVVATSHLIGEGFDDPTIDSVVVTYPSTSIGHLMQVAGRALRISAGKSSAHIVQVRESPLQYHFEQRWLYQDISDALLPVLLDFTYANSEDLRGQVHRLLMNAKVSMSVVDRVERELLGVTVGERVNLMLTGQPYWGAAANFVPDSNWGALLVTDLNRPQFLEIFNEVCSRSDDLRETTSFLQQWIRLETTPGSSWRSYVDLVQSMEYARRELTHVQYAGASSRPYSKPVGTTWLRYVTFTYSPSVPHELEAFLADAVNRAELLAEYEANSQAWQMSVKLELPMAGTIAYLLSDEQAKWFEETRNAVVDHCAPIEPVRTIEAVEQYCRELDSSPVSLRIVLELRQLLRPDRFAAQVLRLRSAAG
ncbi:MAG: hypothetical protein EOS18_06295 [Mesorhizobium sp.]|nr:MAG: hypothetical protein EOS18_06295 [Mesorhizobium sp.]